MTLPQLIGYEMDYQISLYDRLEQAKPYDKVAIKGLISKSRNVMLEMDRIAFAYGNDPYNAVQEILRKYPTRLLPHHHPRRINDI